MLWGNPRGFVFPKSGTDLQNNTWHSNSLAERSQNECELMLHTSLSNKKIVLYTTSDAEYLTTSDFNLSSVHFESRWRTSNIYSLSKDLTVDWMKGNVLNITSLKVCNPGQTPGFCYQIVKDTFKITKYSV